MNKSKQRRINKAMEKHIAGKVNHQEAARQREGAVTYHISDLETQRKILDLHAAKTAQIGIYANAWNMAHPERPVPTVPMLDVDAAHATAAKRIKKLGYANAKS